MLFACNIWVIWLSFAQSGVWTSLPMLPLFTCFIISLNNMSHYTELTAALCTFFFTFQLQQ